MSLSSIFLVESALFLAGCLASFLLTRRCYVARIRSSEAEKKLAEHKFAKLNEEFYAQLEEHFQTRVKEWWPEPGDADEAFAQAEVMANRRAMRDAGRTHLPREGAAEPGRVHSGKLRTRR